MNEHESRTVREIAKGLIADKKHGQATFLAAMPYFVRMFRWGAIFAAAYMGVNVSGVLPHLG